MPILLANQVTEVGPDQIRFIAYMGCIVAAMAGGYVARRTGLAKPGWARPVMSAAIIGCDAPIAGLAVWHLTIREGIWKVPVLGGMVAVATCLVGLAVARARRMPPGDAAVFGLQSGMGNVGYTLGGSLAFALWGVQGLAVEQMYCLMWPFFAFLFCFPLARHYGQRAAGEAAGESGLHYAGRILLRSLTDLRSLPLYTAALGLTLNLRAVAPPAAIQRWHVLDALMVIGIVAQFGGVGMTVVARRLPVFWKKAMGTAALKFLVSPALTLVLALAMGLTGMPLEVCLLLAVMPSALYSVLIANLFHLNKDLANATFILTHAVCLSGVAVGAAAWRLGFLPAG
ncbi:MAG: AEC family transporter [Planctomycetes bacterium]|nr:AEC family transporter [Planctomycetota bacterium]